MPGLLLGMRFAPPDARDAYVRQRRDPERAVGKGSARVRAVTGKAVYKVMLVVSGVRGVDAGFLYRGRLPKEAQEIDVENESDPGDRRRARVTRITQDHESVIQGSLIHATQIEP
jgi:hypothetical protein